VRVLLLLLQRLLHALPGLNPKKSSSLKIEFNDVRYRDGEHYIVRALVRCWRSSGGMS
jgi:hypothetical protein